MRGCDLSFNSFHMTYCREENDEERVVNGEERDVANEHRDSGSETDSEPSRDYSRNESSSEDDQNVFGEKVKFTTLTFS